MTEDKSYPYSPGSQQVDTSIEAAELIKEGAETIRRKVFDVYVIKEILELLLMKYQSCYL